MAGAMRALLPAVDANDEAKTLAVLRFFCVVLSSVPRLEVPVGSGSRSLLAVIPAAADSEPAWQCLHCRSAVGWRNRAGVLAPSCLL